MLEAHQNFWKEGVYKKGFCFEAQGESRRQHQLYPRVDIHWYNCETMWARQSEASMMVDTFSAHGNLVSYALAEAPEGTLGWQGVVVSTLFPKDTFGTTPIHEQG